MSDTQYDGFLFEFYRADANSAGGRRRSEFIVVASSAHEAHQLVPMAGAALIDSGPEILAKARALGIADGDGSFFQ